MLLLSESLWSKIMDSGTFQKKFIRCVDIKAIRPNQIVVNTYNLKRSVRRWRLYKRYTDFTVDRCTETLKNLDKDEDEDGLTDVMELVQDPNAWSMKNPTYDDQIDLSNNTKAQQWLDDFAMSPSQKDISVSIFQRRLQIIWGPPVSCSTSYACHWKQDTKTPPTSPLLTGIWKDRILGFVYQLVHQMLQ